MYFHGITNIAFLKYYYFLLYLIYLIIDYIIYNKIDKSLSITDPILIKSCSIMLIILFLIVFTAFTSKSSLSSTSLTTVRHSADNLLETIGNGFINTDGSNTKKMKKL